MASPPLPENFLPTPLLPLPPPGMLKNNYNLKFLETPNLLIAAPANALYAYAVVSQTSTEIEANFGQKKFVYNFADEI